MRERGEARHRLCRLKQPHKVSLRVHAHNAPSKTGDLLLLEGNSTTRVFESLRVHVDIFHIDVESGAVVLILFGIHAASQMFWSSSSGFDHPIVHSRHSLLVELPVKKLAVESAHFFRVVYGDFKVYDWLSQLIHQRCAITHELY